MMPTRRQRQRSVSELEPVSELNEFDDDLQLDSDDGDVTLAGENFVADPLSPLANSDGYNEDLTAFKFCESEP